jgi:serine/threonine protein kinase
MDDEFSGYLVKGRYKLIDKLAEGAFGSVYITRDLETNYLYAVKLLHDKFMRNPEIVARFQREAYLPQGISNPHIVRVIDYGFDNRFYFIVMDYIDGHNLRVVMNRSGPLPADLALNYAQQVIQGLEAANRHGVVHRDLKPQNILVTNRGEIKITDFGLARGKDMPTITETDEFMGTAYYISPEQIDSGHSVDIRADLYSVAAILFEMLAGHPPYRGNNVMELIMKHKSAPIPSICEIRADLPAAADLFFRKALAKDPAQRYQSPEEFVMALDYLRRSLQATAGQSGSLAPVSVAPTPVPSVTPGPAAAAQEILLYQQDTIRESDGKKAETPAPACLVHLVSGERFPLIGEELIVGRRDPHRNLYPDISLADKMVGRRHARIRNRQGTFTVEDLHSRNKTRLNGTFLAPEEEHLLKHGDIVRFGNVELRFELTDVPATNGS